MAAPDRQEIARLQAQAARNPAAYRWRLGAIAVAGDVALTAIQILPIALPIFIGLMFYNFPYKFWLFTVVVAFLAWMMRPSFRFHGREVTPSEAPRLFAEIAGLREKLQAPGRMQVMLDDSFNASAAETRGLLGLTGTRCALTLGVPLLAALNREEVLGVVAHELGHFSRRHGRLGHWLYRARVGWLAYASDVADSGSALDRAAAFYAERFVPYFSTLSFVHSRQCEYEADADAAAAVGSRIFAQALTRLELGARMWEDGFPREVRRMQREEMEAPADLYERFIEAAANCPAEEKQRWLDEALVRPSNWQDTHPSLAERLAAMRENPGLVESPGNAGAVLLGDAWSGILSEFNTQWRKRTQAEWLFEHFRHKHLHEPLLAAADAAVAEWSSEQRLARARALRAVKPAEGLADLRSLHARHPGHRGIAFALGAALLAEEDPAGTEILQRLAKEDATFRFPSYARLAGFYARRNDSDDAERWARGCEQSFERRMTAASALIRQAEEGRLGTSSLSPEARTVLREIIRRDDRVLRCHLAEGEAALMPGDSTTPVPFRVHFLFLMLDPERLRSADSTESDVGACYEDVLGGLIAANDQQVVRTYFTTQIMSPALEALLKEGGEGVGG